MTPDVDTEQISARDIVKSFGATTALRGASISAAHGEIVAVMGPSGSGISTLLHLAALAIIAATLPLLERITGPAAAGNE